MSIVSFRVRAAAVAILGLAVLDRHAGGAIRQRGASAGDEAGAGADHWR